YSLTVGRTSRSRSSLDFVGRATLIILRVIAFLLRRVTSRKSGGSAGNRDSGLPRWRPPRRRAPRRSVSPRKRSIALARMLFALSVCLFASARWATASCHRSHTQPARYISRRRAEVSFGVTSTHAGAHAITAEGLHKADGIAAPPWPCLAELARTSSSAHPINARRRRTRIRLSH